MIFTCFSSSSHWIPLHPPTVKLRRKNWTDSFVSRWGRVSLPSLGCPGTGFVDTWPWAHRDPSASAFQLLGFKVCGTQSLSTDQSVFCSRDLSQGPKMCRNKRCLPLLTTYNLQFNLVSGETKYIPKWNPTPKWKWCWERSNSCVVEY